MTDAVTITKASRKTVLTSVAIDMLQSRGFSALGLRDLAQAACIKASSLYNHFASKEELAFEAMALYSARQRAELASLGRDGRGSEQIAAYATLFEGMLEDDDRICLALVFAVERNALPAAVLSEIKLFIGQNTAWLASAWELGRADRSVCSLLPGDAAGELIFSAFEGMMAFSLLQPQPAASFRRQAFRLLSALGVRGAALDFSAAEPS